MTETPIHLAVVVGSVREGRFGPTVARWFADRAATLTDPDPDPDPDTGTGTVFTVDLVDLADTGLEGGTFAGRIETAEAVAVVTPEYNHSFPGPLKTAVDAAGDVWRAKPVGFVSYGGLSGGLRAVEHLRPVFAELHATTIRDTVSFHGASARFDPHGQPRDDDAEEAAAVLLGELARWGHVLREARTGRLAVV